MKWMRRAIVRKPKKKTAAELRPNERPFPWMDPFFPLKNWIDRETGHSFQTATIRQDDGSFVAIIVSDPSFRFTAKTQQEAERGVSLLYMSGDADNRGEDADDIRVVREREGDEFLSLSQLRRFVPHGR